MRILVCYPPDFSIPTMPFGTLALFNACLKNEGHDVKIVDLAAFTFKHLAARKNMEHHYELLEEELAKPQTNFNRASAEAYRGLSHLLSIPREMVLDGEAAFQRLRDPVQFAKPEVMLRDTRSLFAVDRILSVLRPRFDPGHPDFTENIYDYLSTDAFNPWVECYEQHLLPEMRAFSPDLVAVTIPFATQITATLCFSKWIRARFPDAKVVIGGTAVSAAEQVLLEESRFYDYVDFAITGEGDEALPLLADRLQADLDLSEVSNLYRRAKGEILKPKRRDLPDMNESPTYDYSGIDFELYAVPEKISCMTTSRGCYYGKCTFCPETLKGGFRRRSSSMVWEDVRNIAVEQGIRNFMFWDPLTPLAVMEELSNRSIEENIDIRWMAQVKFDAMFTDSNYLELLARGGCKSLQFGFESGVQRVLDDMEKGNDLEEMDVILPKIEKAGIAVGIFFFIGFPTELEEDAKESWRYLVRHRDRIQFAGYLGTFGIAPVVPVFRFPERYNIELFRGEQGEIAYRRLDGKDWEFSELHETYFARNDQFLIEAGTPMLYKVLAPQHIRNLTARRKMLAPSFLRNGLGNQVLTVPDYNGFHRLEGCEVDGESLWPTEYVAYAGHSQRMHLIEKEDMLLVDAVKAGSQLIDIAERTRLEHNEATARLSHLLDLGILDAHDPPPMRTSLEREDSSRAPQHAFRPSK